MAKKKDERNKIVLSKTVTAKTDNQKGVIYDVLHNDIIFLIGPAGCGKTHLSVGMALQLLRDEHYSNIVLSRPILECSGEGEGLGYLPGDVEEKMDPYLRPLFTEMKKFMSYSDIVQMRNSGMVDIVALEHMRGCTFENSVMLLDEAQNATKTQLEMCITRMGQGSKMIITGDITQSDLKKSDCYLARLVDEIDNYPDDFNRIVVSHLYAEDVVRHAAVKIMLNVFRRIG